MRSKFPASTCHASFSNKPHLWPNLLQLTCFRDRVWKRARVKRARGVLVMSEAEQIENRVRELLTELDDLSVTVAHH